MRIWNENGEDVVKKFKYNLPFDCCFCYRRAVDYHNNLIHPLTSIEDTCVTYQWECRVFDFILAISEVNEFLILRYFVYCWLLREGMPALLDFFGIWCGNLLTIYKFGNGRGVVSSFHNPFIGWWLHQGTWDYIRTGGGFSLQKVPINSTAAALNAKKDKDLLDRVQPKTSPFSTRHLIWVNYKVVSQLAQPILSFLHLNNARHNLVIELCLAL